MKTMQAIVPKRFRKNTKRAVSPIIATILLVAITVVLAAVLYVLISGLVHGPGNTPIGSALGFGTVQLQAVGATAQTGCLANHYCYEVAVSSASSGVTIGSINVKVVWVANATVYVTGPAVGSTGLVTFSTIAGATAGASASLPVSTAFSVSSWSSGTGTSLVTSDILWIDLGWSDSSAYGLTHSPTGQGLQLQVFGVGSYSGSETVNLP
jgi:flagellin-like protein